MQVAILMTHVAIAIALVVLILLQQGKGAEAGAAFGGGASQAGEAPEAGIPDAELIEQQNAVPTLDDGGSGVDNSAPALEESGD